MDILHFFPHAHLPEINHVPSLKAFEWLGRGWQDLRKSPAASLGHGFLVTMLMVIAAELAYGRPFLFAGSLRDLSRGGRYIVFTDTVSATSRDCICCGSNVGRRYVLPTFGVSPSATASGASVGTSTGPRTVTRWVSALCPGTSMAKITTLSPSARPTTRIGVCAASACTSNVLRARPRDNRTTDRAEARCDWPATGRSATK